MHRFIFRVESNNQEGMGHFYRCLALARILDGYHKTFLMNKYQQNLFDILNTSSIELKTLNLKSPYTANTDELVKFIDEDDIVILDGYHFDESYMKVLKKLAARLVVIDDLNNGKYYADIIINHGPHIQNVRYNIDAKAKLLLGREYLLLRPPFYQNAGKSELRDQVKVITICFGGADSRDFTSIYLKALNLLENYFKVNIVLGGSNNNSSSKYLKFEQKLLKINIFRNISDEKMASLLLESDLLIATPSGITLEACTLNIPIIAQVSFQNQDLFFKYLRKNGIATCIHSQEADSSKGLADAIKKTITDTSYRKTMVQNQKKKI